VYFFSLSPFDIFTDVYVARIEYAALFRAMYLYVEQEWDWCWKPRAEVPLMWPSWHPVIFYALFDVKLVLTTVFPKVEAPNGLVGCESEID
jgi:hypothetical protein